MTKKEFAAIVQQARDMTKAGRVVEAIRLLRATTGCGIKEAYDVINKYFR